MNSTAIRRKNIDRIKNAFFRNFRPPSPIEDAEVCIANAMQDLRDTTRPDRERFNSAIRLICCIPAINIRLTETGSNEIFSRAGVMPPAD